MSAASQSPGAQPSFIAQVERLHALVAVVACIVAVAVAARPIWSAVVAGTLVGAANFHMLAVLTTRILSGSTASRNLAVGILFLKFTVVAGVLGAVMHWLQPDGVALLAALSLAPVCLVAVLLRGRKAAASAPTPPAPVDLLEVR